MTDLEEIPASVSATVRGGDAAPDCAKGAGRMIRGAIFDLDGTLLDSTPYWDRAPNVYLASIGRQGRESLGQEIFHMTLPRAAEYMIAEFGLTQSPEEVADGVNAVMRRFYLEDIPVKEGVPALLAALRGRGLPLAVASVTDRRLVEAVLRRFDLWRHFTGVVTTDDVGVGKQEPDVYLRAAALINCVPEETLVFEDAIHALRTANRAGFRTVGVYDEASRNRQAEMRSESEFYLRDFKNTESFLEGIEKQRVRPQPRTAPAAEPNPQRNR